jgi:hypothetical protein
MSFVTDPADAIAREEARVGYARDSVPAGYDEANTQPAITT